MGFLAPWFLAGAAAIGLPIYLHLLRRQTTTPHPFSSLMFFEQRTQSSVKHRRLRYWLLLSLRMAVLLLLALAFANPFINRPAASLSGEKLQMIVVDDSFSMRAGSRLDDAKREALSLLGSRRASERGQVVALDSQLHVLTEPTEDGSALHAAVESVQPGDSRGNFGALASAIRSIGQTVRTPIELHLISDMQKSAMPASFSELALPPNVSLVLHPVVKSTVPNWAVVSVNAPSEVWDPKKARVQAVIGGYHTPAASRTVSLVINGKTSASKSVQVPANGRATVEFQPLDVPFGFSKCEIRIDSADALPADDANRFAVERADPRHVLFVHEASDSRSPLYFRSALASAAEAAFALDVVTAGQVDNLQPSKYAFVVLSDLLSVPSTFENSLVSYVRNGGSVLIAAGASSARRPRLPVTGDAILESRYYSRNGQHFLTVGDVDPSYSDIEKADRWAGVKFYFAIRVDPGGAHVIARLTDQTPLLLEKKVGNGRVLLLTSGLDNLTNDFPLHPDFVPFVEQTARYLSGTESRGNSRQVDSFLELRTAKEQSVGVEIIDPDGRRPLSLKEAASAQSFQLAHAGFYELRLANGRQDLIGVNPDPQESDLEVLPDNVMALWQGSPNEKPQAATATETTTSEPTRPYGLWWYLLAFALLAGIAESWLSGRYLGVHREEL